MREDKLPPREDTMDDRERFQAIMRYGQFDRGIIQDFSYWDETVEIWRAYGLPKEVSRSETPDVWRGRDIPKNVHRAYTEDFFGLDIFWQGVGGNVLLCPGFEGKVLEDEGDTVILREFDGTVVRKHKFMSSIPVHLSHTLMDRASWEAHYKWRLDPDHPGRLPADFDARLAAHTDATRTWPISTNAGSLFGQLRNWMGLEGVTYIQVDDPPLFREMLATIADCIVGTLRRVLERATAAGVTFDYASMWEDMSCAQGPLLSKAAFDEFLVPGYKRISDLLREHGCDFVMLDSDGDVRALLDGWLEAGVNIAFPLEVGTWGQDAIEVRRRLGPEMRICGGFDKHILARTTDGIAREIDRLAPLVEAGGFVPFCDHRVPPDVSLSNYLFYVDRAKQVWGRGLANLRPTGKPDTSAPLYGRPYDYTAALESLGR